MITYGKRKQMYKTHCCMENLFKYKKVSKKMA